MKSARLALAAASAAALAAFTALPGTVSAQTVTGSWGVNASGNWTGTPGNWVGGIIPGNAGDTANFNYNLTAGATVTLNTNESVGILNIVSLTSNAYILTGPGTLTFDSGSVGVPAQLNTLAGNPSSDTISAPIVLNSNLVVTNGDIVPGKPITLSGATLAGNGNSITFHGSGSYYGGNDNLTIANAITNVPVIRSLYGSSDASGNPGIVFTISGSISNGATATELDNYGDGGLSVSGIITTTAGLTVNGPGSLNTMTPVAPNSQTTTGMVKLTGANAITGATTVNAGYLYLDYSATGGNNSKIDSGSALTLNSSYLFLNGASAASVQAVNGLTVGGGANEIKLAAGSVSTTFNTGSGAITRNGNATLDINNAAATATIVLGSSAALSNGILPAWITTNAGQDWATVNGTNQIVVLPSAGYTTAVPTSGANPTVNYKAAAGTTLAGTLTANSLNLTGGGVENLSGNNLTLTSGGLLTNTASTITFNGNGGSLVAGSGSSELILQTNNNAGLLQINAPVSAGSVTKSGAGEALLLNSSIPTGQFTVNQGTLSLASGVSLSGNLALNSGGALGLSGTYTAALGSGAGQVQFGPGGGGFSAVGGPLTVNIGGSGATLNSSQLNGTLVLNNIAATNPITLVNPLNIDNLGLTLSVGNAGSVSGQAGSSVNLGNNGYAYSLVGAISGSGDLRVQGSGSPPGGGVLMPAGLLVPTGALTYSGVTVVTGTTLYASPNAASLPATTSLQLFSAGVLATSGTFNWSLGNAPGHVTLGGFAGFAAMGGPLNVLIGNSTADPVGSRFNNDLTLGSPFAGNSVNYQNNITGTANVVAAGPVVQQLSGTISGTGTFSAAGGGGVLFVPGVNTFTGTWSVGGLSSILQIGSGNNSSTGSLDSSLGLAGSPLVAAGFNISNGGSGYGTSLTNIPLTIAAPGAAGGTQAVGFATSNSSGGIVSFTLTGGSTGNGYFNAPTITVGGSGSGAVIVPSNGGTAWFSGNTIGGGTLDLNGTTTSEPIQANANNGSPFGGYIINSNVGTAATINGDVDLNITNNTGPNAEFSGPGNITVNGNVYGGNVQINYFKFGEGTLTLNGTNFEGGAGAAAGNMNMSSYGGTLILNDAATNSNKLFVSGTGFLKLYNTNLQLVGSSTGATNQTVGGSGGTQFLLGGSSVSVTASGSQNANLSLGAISRMNGTSVLSGTADFQTTNGAGGGVASILTTSSNLSGILAPTVTAGGSYASAPTVTFNTPAGGSAATGVAIWNSGTGAVTGIIITNPGAGYTSAPTITFSGSGGAAATGNFGSYGYLGGWTTFGNGASFATVSGGKIGPVPDGSYGTVVAPAALLDVGLGNGGGAVTYTDSTGTPYAAAGIGSYASGPNITQTVGAIRFNSFSTAASPNTLLIAPTGGNATLFIGNSNNGIGGDGDAAGGILDTANTGNASGGAPSVISGGIIWFGGNGYFSIAQYNTAQPLQINSALDQLGSNGNATIVKSGPGELQLTNTVNSAIAVFGGTVTANTTASMGNGITLGNGSTFKYAAINIINSSGNVLTSANSGTYTRTVTLNGPATFDNESGNALNFSSTGNDFAVNASSPWDLTITGNAGGDIVLSGGISIGATYTPVYGQPTASTITPGFGQLIKNGSNNLVINGTSLISGGVIVNNGILQLSGTLNTLPTNEPITINANSSAGTLGILEIGSSCFDAVGPVTLNGGSITGATTNEGNNGSGTGTLQAMAYNFNAGTASVNLAGIVGVYKATTGTVILSGSNTFTGTTSLNAGVLNVGSAENPGVSGPLGEPTILANSLQMNGGTLQYSANNQYDYSNRFGTGPNLQFNADTNGQMVSWASSLNSAGGSLSLSDTVGTGKLTLMGSNTYTGNTLVTGGTLVAGSVNALSHASAFNISGGSVNASGGTLDASGFNSSIASLVVGAYGTLDLGAATLLTDTGTAAFAGTFNLVGTPASLPYTVMTYASRTGTFNTVNLPAGDSLSYLSGSLQIVVGSAGPANLVWNNNAGTGVWNTADANWSNGAGSVAYSDTSNGSTGDLVTFSDNNAGNYNVTISGVVHPSSVTFANSAGNYNITGGGIGGTTGVTLTGTSTVTIASSNTYTGGTNVSAGKLVLASAGAFPSGTGNAGSGLIVASGATLQIANHGAGATITPIVSSYANTGTIDLTNNAMILRNAAGSFGSISGQVAAAFNNGNWNGSSGSGVITSTLAASDATHLTAVGIATGLTTTFEGVSVTSSDVLVKYTYYGDANLDGSVGSADYTLIDAGFLSAGSLTGWQNGDFNYDGVINGSDYTLIDNAFNTQGAGLASQIASPTAQIGGGTASAVPEPTSLGLLAIGAVGLLGRRRRT